MLKCNIKLLYPTCEDVYPCGICVSVDEKWSQIISMIAQYDLVRHKYLITDGRNSVSTLSYPRVRPKLQKETRGLSCRQ